MSKKLGTLQQSTQPALSPGSKRERSKLSQCEVITLSFFFFFLSSIGGVGECFQFIVCFMSHNAEDSLPKGGLGGGGITAGVFEVHGVHRAAHNCDCGVPKESCSTVWLWSVCLKEAVDSYYKACTH